MIIKYNKFLLEKVQPDFFVNHPNFYKDSQRKQPHL